MNALQVLFKTSLFNLSKVGEHFIHPYCFGEDLARWLRIKLIKRRVEVDQPYREDWDGNFRRRWETMSGNSNESSTNKDEGEWRLILKNRRTIGQWLRGTGKIAPNDEILRTIEEILSAESMVREVHREK